MASGLDLLTAARSMTPAELAEAYGYRASRLSEVTRPAVIGALLSEYRPEDAPLIRQLTRLEMAAVRAADDGCGDTLLACCWLLFMLGDVADSALIWEAKNVNFDAHCSIDSVFLITAGADATAAFARREGLDDLAAWVSEWVSDPEEGARDWRAGSFFDTVPPAEASAEELAAWLKG